MKESSRSVRRVLVETKITVWNETGEVTVNGRLEGTDTDLKLSLEKATDGLVELFERLEEGLSKIEEDIGPILSQLTPDQRRELREKGVDRMLEESKERLRKMADLNPSAWRDFLKMVDGIGRTKSGKKSTDLREEPSVSPLELTILSPKASKSSPARKRTRSGRTG